MTIMKKNFGKTFFYFKIGNDIHLVLDSELNNGDIDDNQLKLLQNVRDMVFVENSISNVFIYSHRTLWSKSYDELDGLFHDNTQSSF